MKRIRLISMLAAAAAPALAFAQDAAVHAAGDSQEAGPPALTVVVIVDQLTAERTREWALKPSSSGFRRLWRNGVVYANAAYGHATTATAPGHATIATGVHPSVHGVISNYWFDRELGRPIASVRDDGHSLVGGAKGVGVSPARLAAPALADLLHAETGGQARIYAVSIKDRGAVFLAGKHGKAFWYSTDTGGFVSSSYYYPGGRVPQWLTAYNAAVLEAPSRRWELLLSEGDYRYGDEREWERPPLGWTRTFPHEFAPAGTRPHFDQLRYAPHGDAITAGLARAIIERESLGEDAVPDLLAISLSATDRIGHAFGHNSREAEDNLHRLDRLLAQLTDFLESRLPRERFLMVLGSDHGMRPIPESVPGTAPQNARLFPFALARELNGFLGSAFGVEQDLVRGMAAPWLYLNPQGVAEAGLEEERVVDEARRWLEALPQVSRAIPASGLEDCERNGEQAQLCRLIGKASYPGRSGEIYLVSAENSFFSAEPPRYAASHGSPYLSDRRVPMIFYGAVAGPAVVDRPVAPRHVAPTLAEALGIAPDHNWEAPLAEVLTARQGKTAR